jgi:hypothetical protein
MTHPGLQGGGRQDFPGGVFPDNGFGLERSGQLEPIDQTARRQPAAKQEIAKEWTAGGQATVEMDANLPLGPPFDDQTRQTVGEGLSGKTALSFSSAEDRRRDCKADFDDRLSEQGMDNPGSLGPTRRAVGREVGDQRPNLPPLGH